MIIVKARCTPEGQDVEVRKGLAHRDRQRGGPGPAAAALFLASAGAAALGALENPQPGGIATGIGAITGWHCTSRNIEVRIDGVSAGLAGAGTSRLDTAGLCGSRSDTGFSLLYNYALLQGGTHRADVYADGVPFAGATFEVGYLGAEFLRGPASAHRIPNFPAHGLGARVVWEESKQNFVIADVVPLTLFGLSATGTGSTGGLVISTARSQAAATSTGKAGASGPTPMGGGLAMV